jgi:serine/threonine protein kinase
LLTNDHQVKLADFGLGNRFGLHRLNTICGNSICASSSHSITHTSFIQGSMLYYSPEIISARAYVGPEVDCWCLGIILFRMTAGYEPFAHAKSKFTV